MLEGNHKYARLQQTPVDRNKYLTLNRCPLGNYEYKNQNKSDQIAILFTKFGQGNFKGVAKQCFD